MDIRMCSRTSALGGRLLSRLAVLFSVPFLVGFLLVSAGCGVLESPTEKALLDERSSSLTNPNTQDESLSRGRLVTADGVFIVYDAPRIKQGRSAPPRYVAYFNSYEDGILFVYGRLLESRADVGHALRNLQRDVWADAQQIADSDPVLRAGLEGAFDEPEDATP